MVSDRDPTHPEFPEPTRKFEPIRQDPAEPDPARPGPPRSDPPGVDPARPDPARPDQARPEHRATGSAHADEEALRWDGDDATERFTPAGSEHQAKPARRDAATGSALLIVYGAFGGIYLLMTVGWVATALRYLTTTADPLAAFMQRVSTILAVLAPGAWFAVVFWLTRGRPAWQRIIWLALGVLLVAPWPLISGSLG